MFSTVNGDKRVDQLKLALAWNRVDVAVDQIFKDDVEWKVYFQCIIVIVIIIGQHFIGNFVDLFLLSYCD